MSEQTRGTEEEITRNYRQMVTAKEKGEDVLVDLFQVRMNRSLDELSDYYNFLGEAVLLGDGKAT